ncbi:hypothetical protein MATL_G00055730 [Megalops atlanticus]|uniref:Evolutionarily conserved signaling intermediate in Toll pathway, mitochondrial n=1 Tax=Megalops atlanticus TaxID=7932 RepID=A0A9D3TJ98_MEGAT|nr:hypothetical protein MATL_G00055730 [Megalops atlanticus]
MRCARSLVRIQSLRALTAAAGGTVQPAATRKAPHARSLIAHEPCGQALRSLHTACVLLKNRPVATDYQEKSEREGEAAKSLVTYDDLFERAALEAKTKATFNQVLDVFIKRDIRRRGHVEFIYAALRKMPEFGVERDLEVYNKLLDVFPKEIFVPRNYIQRMFNHYPRQQECGVQVLEQMENYGIMPNVQTKVLLVQIFGEKSHPVRKYQRLLYWFPRFKHANPFPVPHQLPQDPVDLARFSLSRIANDLDARVTVYQLPYTDVCETGEEVTQPYVVGIQSPDQRHLLAKHNPSRPVFVEGPFPLWLRKTCVYYYVLRADPLPPEEKVEEPVDPERCFYYPLQLELDLERDLGDDDSFDVDEVDEGPVFAMCMAGRGDQATLAKWISGLQETNPILGRTATVFRLESGVRELQSAAEPEPEARPGEEEEELQSRGVKQ